MPYRCALVIRDYVKNLLEMEMSNDELLYLVIHLTRIVDRDDDEARSTARSPFLPPGDNGSEMH